MVNNKRFYMFILIFITAFLTGFLLYNYRQKIGRLITPFIIAAFISYLVYPIVIWLEQRGVPRTGGILITYLSFLFLMSGIIIFLIPELTQNTRELLNTLPQITAKYQEFFNKIVSVINSSKWSEDMKLYLFRQINTGISTAQSYVDSALKKSLGGLIGAVTMFFDIAVAMVIAYYFMKDSGFFRTMILSTIPRSWRNGLATTGREINEVLTSFIQGQLLTALIVGTMEIIGLVIVGAKYPIFLGLLGGVANIIPYFGPIIGAVPAVAIALIDSPVKALWTALVFIIVQQVDNALISPKVIERRLGLHPVTTIFTVMVGGEFFGITGMLFSVPVMAILKVIFKNIIEAIV